MNVLFSIVEFVFVLFCRHEWVRDRQPNGDLGLRCMRCGKLTEDQLTRLIRSKPKYQPVSPPRTELSGALQHAGKKERSAA